MPFTILPLGVWLSSCNGSLIILLAELEDSKKGSEVSLPSASALQLFAQDVQPRSTATRRLGEWQLPFLERS